MRTIKAIIIAICCIFLTTACSKKIMPPEIEVAGSVSEETDFTTSSSPETDFGWYRRIGIFFGIFCGLFCGIFWLVQ